MSVLAAALITLQAPTIRVSDREGLQLAIQRAQPGTTIFVAPGTYRGGFAIANLHGTIENRIVIAGAKEADPPKFVGGGSGMQLSSVSHIELRDLAFEGATGNGLNIDDGGTIVRPSHHVTLKRIQARNLPKGNHDGIKLSGLDDFRVEDCQVTRWGGSGIDMVGCHRGVITGSVFREGGDSAIQAKGGTSDIRIQASRFVDFGQRGVNIGGSTGAPFFRPSLQAMGSQKFEAKGITVEGCTFVRGVAAVAFVGVDGATVRFNTIVDPGRWALRILQETREPGFVPSRNGTFTDNLVVFRTTGWASGGLNVGPGTSPESFRFARNFWFCSDAPERSRPLLPTPEVAGTYGVDPRLRLSPEGVASVGGSDHATKAGAHAWPGRRE